MQQLNIAFLAHFNGFNNNVSYTESTVNKFSFFFLKSISAVNGEIEIDKKKKKRSDSKLIEIFSEICAAYKCKAIRHTIFMRVCDIV